jgi:hypothetical protein
MTEHHKAISGQPGMAFLFMERRARQYKETSAGESIYLSAGIPDKRFCLLDKEGVK